MKKEIEETGKIGKMGEIGEKLKYRLKQLCGRPSPVKRLVSVLVICSVFAVANIYFVVRSIYSIGKNDAEKELIKLQHIERLNFQQNDSINQIKQKMYEYE